MNRYLAFAGALLFASLTVSSACFAEPSDGGSRRLVRYGGLDLSTAAGVAALNRRIEHALNQVCLDPNGPSPAGTVDIDCKRDGHHAARPQIAVAIARQKLAKPGIETQFSGTGSAPSVDELVEMGGLGDRR